MRRWFKVRLLTSIMVALLVVLVVSVPISSATTASIVVTATPSFVGITISQNTWTINGIDGSGKIAPNTTYYSNGTGATGDVTAPSATVVDGECYFTVTNAATIVTDLTTNMSDFSGGDASTNSNSGYASNGATTYGASTYISGSTWPDNAVILKSSASDAMKSSLAATTDLKFGVAIKTQSDAWTSGSAMTSTITVTSTAH
jgi:hypothetical protein